MVVLTCNHYGAGYACEVLKAPICSKILCIELALCSSLLCYLMSSRTNVAQRIATLAAIYTRYPSSSACRSLMGQGKGHQAHCWAMAGLTQRIGGMWRDISQPARRIQADPSQPVNRQSIAKQSPVHCQSLASQSQGLDFDSSRIAEI